LLATFLLHFISCNHTAEKKITDEGLPLKELLALAPELSYPIVITDSLLQQPGFDSMRLHTSTFLQYLPDTLVQRIYPEKKELHLYVLGKATLKDNGTYLLVRSDYGKKKKNIYLFYFSAQPAYLGNFLLSNQLKRSGNVHRYCKIDSRQNIAFITEQKMPTGEYWTGETIYYLNSQGQPVLAVTNTNEDLSDEIRGNPIDTLPRKHAHSADYSTDSKNLVSIRDGQREGTFEFFIHFSKQKGQCIGEVKGTGQWVSAHKGIFTDNNTPCVIAFQFTGKSVTISEVEGCGAYRGITCFFEGTYPRVKTAKPAKSRK
jgi:hypothetical protein